MGNPIGPPVRGDELKFREKDINEILSRLSDGNSVLLIGLRRIGKSSVMMSVKDKAPSDWLVSYYDVQDKHLPSDLFSVFLKSLSEKDYEKLISIWSNLKTVPARIINTLKQSLNKLGGGGINVELNKDIVDYWHPLTQGIEAIIKEKKFPIILILDEFPFFIEHILKSGTSKHAVEEMLGLLRVWRGKYNHFRLLIGGSISLDRILRKWDIEGSTIKDFSRYFLPAFTKEEARKLLKILSVSYGLSWYDNQKIEKTLILLEDYYPFFVRSFFSQIRMYGETEPLDTIFENHFIPSIRQGYFDQFSDRLRKHYTFDEKKAAKAIFTFISQKNDKKASYSQLRDIIQHIELSDELEVDDLLSDLTADEFLMLDPRTSEYSFVSNLLAKWWKMTRGA
jgi:AAA+ ATPase superfamily predicted ATPase